MANETTTTTMTGAINTSLIASGMLAYAIDEPVALQYLRQEPVAGRGTKTAAFAVPTKASAAGAITEGTGLTTTFVALTFANTTVAISEVGLQRRVTKLAARTNVLGAEEATYQFVIEDGGRLCVEKMETDAWAQWANASTSTGTSGSAYQIADFANAISQLAINKARGNPVALLTTTQMKNLRAALVASTAVVFTTGAANQVLERTMDNGYCGSLFGVPIWTSNLAATSGADKIGVVMIDGDARPANAATGLAMGWMPEPEQVSVPMLTGRDIAVTAAYGVAEISDFNYVKQVSIA